MTIISTTKDKFSVLLFHYINQFYLQVFNQPYKEPPSTNMRQFETKPSEHSKLNLDRYNYTIFI